MCGIAALISIGAVRNLDAIEAMAKAQRHRGPDDEGYLFIGADGGAAAFGGDDTPDTIYTSPYYHCPRTAFKSAAPAAAAFGHRRLSIVDLSAGGHQPFGDTSGAVWVAYNGEIYNHVELRSELEKCGHIFVTHSDTEVLVAAWKEWGERCLDRFNGMFAFVLYDKRQERFFAARDRFGIKPLYYWVSPQGFIAIASEIKAFISLPGWEPQLNGQTAYDFLNWGLFDHNAETFFQGVFQLRGGQSLTHDLFAYASPGRMLPTKQWYTLKEAMTPKWSLAECSEEFGRLLEDAVRLRLRADVPIGSCLSGGLDSSSIVCLANRQLRENSAEGRQHTFSACSHIPRYDERLYIDAVVEATGATPHYTTPCHEELFRNVEQIVWHQDQPFASTSIYAQWLVFALAKEQNVKVMLDGQGADEQLCGYHGFFGDRHYDLLKTLRWRRLYREMKSATSAHSHLPFRAMLVGKLLPELFRQPLRRAFGKSATKPPWLALDRLDAIDRAPLPSGSHGLRAQSRRQLLSSSLPMLLHYEDRDSMAHSIEARTPFLDYRLVEFTLGAAGHHKIEGAWTKRMLRESMADVLPSAVKERIDKIAFATAEEEWLKRESPDTFRKAMRESIEQTGGIITEKAADHLEAMISGGAPFSFMPWRLITFGIWMKRFAVKNPHDAKR